MTTENIIVQNIDILSSELDSNIKEHILKRIKPFCNQKVGYMLEVIEILNIESNPIIRGSNPSFTVTYKAKVLKPKPGMILPCKVTIIFSQGIIFEYNKMELCVAVDNKDKDNKVILNNKKKEFEYKSKKYTIGSEMKLKITKEDYEKHSYKCLAEICE